MISIPYFAFGAVTYFALNSVISSFFVGISLYFNAFYKHFVVLVKEIDSPPIEIKNLDDSPTRSVTQHKKKSHAQQMLNEIIQFHIIVKELVNI